MIPASKHKQHAIVINAIPLVSSPALSSRLFSHALITTASITLTPPLRTPEPLKSRQIHDPLRAGMNQPTARSRHHRHDSSNTSVLLVPLPCQWPPIPVSLRLPVAKPGTVFRNEPASGPSRFTAVSASEPGVMTPQLSLPHQPLLKRRRPTPLPRFQPPPQINRHRGRPPAPSETHPSVGMFHLLLSGNTLDVLAMCRGGAQNRQCGTALFLERGVGLEFVGIPEPEGGWIIRDGVCEVVIVRGGVRLRRFECRGVLLGYAAVARRFAVALRVECRKSFPIWQETSGSASDGVKESGGCGRSLADELRERD